jgi:hypothetical protein
MKLGKYEREAKKFKPHPPRKVKSLSNCKLKQKIPFAKILFLSKPERRHGYTRVLT